MLVNTDVDSSPWKHKLTNCCCQKNTLTLCPNFIITWSIEMVQNESNFASLTLKVKESFSFPSKFQSDSNDIWSLPLLLYFEVNVNHVTVLSLYVCKTQIVCLNGRKDTALWLMLKTWALICEGDSSSLQWEPTVSLTVINSILSPCLSLSISLL